MTKRNPAGRIRQGLVFVCCSGLSYEGYITLLFYYFIAALVPYVIIVSAYVSLLPLEVAIP